MSSQTEANSQELLPGIPNEVTLSKISAKLSWRDFYTLSSVSRVWCHAIRSRQVYNARVLHHSTETLVLINYIINERANGIALYSMRGNSCYELPPIPNVAGGFPQNCQSVSLDSKVYVLGGYPDKGDCTSTVYVLDLVGQGQWKQCAAMIEPRANFACGVMHGKIYMFDISGRGEVYDPMGDTWSQLGSSPGSHLCRHVQVLGEEFLLREGFTDCLPMDDDDTSDSSDDDFSKVFEVYNPATDQWRVLDPCCQTNGRIFFTAKGKLHHMDTRNPFCVKVHDGHENSWTHVHSSNFDSVGPVHMNSVMPLAVISVNDVLLAVVEWRTRCNAASRGLCLLRSEGFGSSTNEIRWQKVVDLSRSLKKMAGMKRYHYWKFLMQSFEL
ncbi:unnamed protein product [Calypogeia fissa]